MSIRRRKLDESDLRRMMIPKRYWKSSIDQISGVSPLDDGVSVQSIVVKYIKNLNEMESDGVGILFYGPNGTGKTSAAVCLAKEFRRRFRTVFYVEAANLKTHVAGREHFDEDHTYMDRASSVDVLVLDDLGKGVEDRTGFGVNLIDQLIRTRNSNNRITIITTNLIPKRRGKDQSDTLSGILKESTIHTLKEHVMAVRVEGEDRRDGSTTVVRRKLVE